MPDFCKKKNKISQTTVRYEIWFVTRVDVVAVDGTVAVYFQQFCKTYVQLSVNTFNLSDRGCVRISFLPAYN